MRVFVKVQIFDTFNREEEDYARKVFGAQIQNVLNSGKVLESGVFGDCCGCFYLLDVDSGEQLSRLIVPSVLHNMHVEIHPVMPVDKFSQSPGFSFLPD